MGWRIYGGRDGAYRHNYFGELGTLNFQCSNTKGQFIRQYIKLIIKDKDFYLRKTLSKQILLSKKTHYH
jgi:hypothetical protein